MACGSRGGRPLVAAIGQRRLRSRCGTLVFVVSLAIAVSCRPLAAQPAAEGTAQGATAPDLIPPPRETAPTSNLVGLDTPEGVLGYALGLRIGERMLADFKEQGTDVDPAALARGLADAILKAKPLVDEQRRAAALDGFERRMQALEQAEMARLAEAARRNKAATEAFLRQNGGRGGVRTLPSGLQVEVLRDGTGPRPTLDDVVVTHYVGTHLDGTRFDGTDPEGEPAIFPVRGVVPAWQEALPMMAVGSTWKLYVPPQLAYGESGFPPDIEPNELLIFEIELVAIEGR